MFSTAWNPQRDTKSWVEKRRGREKIEVTWWRKRRVKRGREQSHSQVKLGTENWVLKGTKLIKKIPKAKIKNLE